MSQSLLETGIGCYYNDTWIIQPSHLLSSSATNLFASITMSFRTTSIYSSNKRS